MATEFDKLLAELSAGSQDLLKALPSAGDEGGDEDDNVSAAAADAGAGADGDEPDEEDDDDNDDDQMGKSFEITLADGSKAEAYDATTVLKSLNARVGKHDALLGQTLGVVKNLSEALRQRDERIVQQGDLIKSLRADVKKFGAAGSGRRSVAGGAAPEGKVPATTDLRAAREEILTKALAASAAGRLNAVQVGTIEGHLNKGEPIPPHLRAALV